ncbi:hypothetical protein [Teredinibacter franksiae]|uniref:hypothetical protein n=1 Tax=Teredinibacter franksiae TaxID=2761453 RepID=UPI001628CAE1|nr:hypothetical protein [Teredinibacter franksiae]
MFNHKIMRIPREEEFPKGTRFYIKEFDVPLAMIPEEESVAWYNWFGGEPKRYDVSNLKQENNWEAESFTEWQQLIIESTTDISEYRISEKLVVPSYWALFIILPSSILGIATVAYSTSIWIFVAAIVVLLILGEHGIRWWSKLLKK